MLALSLVLALAPMAAATEEGAASREAVWEGYLYRDTEGRVCLGRPVLAMGVIAMPPQVVGAAWAERLAPLVTDAGDSWTFMNYRLERDDDVRTTKLRAMLVKKSLLLALPEDEPEYADPTHRVRFQTLRHMRRRYRDDPGDFLELELAS